MLQEEMRKIAECDMKFGTLDSSEKTIAIQEIYNGHRRRNRKRMR